MNKIRWFCVDNIRGKRFPEWRRSFGVCDTGTVYVPAAMAGDESEMKVFMCACGDGQSTAVHLEHHFVPSAWLKIVFPKHSDLIGMIEARAQTALSECGI